MRSHHTRAQLIALTTKMFLRNERDGSPRRALEHYTNTVKPTIFVDAVFRVV